MSPLPVDPATLRSAYERQLALLVPVVDGLREAAIAPHLVAVEEWRGPAADAAQLFLRDLHAGLLGAAEAIEREVAVLRQHVAELW
jgi:hypothetical protein